MDHRQIIEKADFLLAQLSNGGLMNAAQADELIRLAIDQAVALPLMSRVDMRAPKELKEKIRYGSRALRKATEATALSVADRSRPDTSKVELDAQSVIAETRLSFETIRDSIERDRFEDTVKEALAERVSLDLEDLAFNGDTSSSDSLLKTLDGFREQTTSNTVAGGSSSLDRALLKSTLKTMPSEFRRDRRALRYFTADEAAIDYHDSIGDRATALGDEHVVSSQTRPYADIPVEGVPVFPTDLGGGSDETDMILTDPGNMLFGVWKEMMLDTQRDVPSRVLIIVLEARVDFKYAEETAAVKTTAITAT